MIKILFFEDQPYASENRLFRATLREGLRGMCTPQIKEEKTVGKFEESIKRHYFNIIILDVMASTPKPIYWEKLEEKMQVPSSLMGVELLRRCRLGVYYYLEPKTERIFYYKNSPIYMRTARGEPHVQQLCEREKASGFFKAGVDDQKLISEIKMQVRKILNKGKR